MMDGWGIAMMALMLLFWAVVIVAAAMLIRHLIGERRRAGSVDRGSTSALEVLERRFAQGEIDADEYGERRTILEGGG